jgi:hypothetical protein
MNMAILGNIFATDQYMSISGSTRLENTDDGSTMIGTTEEQVMLDNRDWDGTEEYWRQLLLYEDVGDRALY